jgi:hypothetical protein
MLARKVFMEKIMNMREAFNEHDLIVTHHMKQNWVIWQAACKWQKDEDAKLCDQRTGNSPDAKTRENRPYRIEGAGLVLEE